jgi:hypothetical protein
MWIGRWIEFAPQHENDVPTDMFPPAPVSDSYRRGCAVQSAVAEARSPCLSDCMVEYTAGGRAIDRTAKPMSCA